MLITREDVGCIEFQVYNRGPQVLEENKQKLFQLGYSTRRTKDHHGKGLGLFFVNEIIKGYEGQLVVENIDNQADSYSIRIGFKNGEVETKIVNVEVIGQRPCIAEDEANETDTGNQSSVRWQYGDAIESVEISSNRMKETNRFSSDEGVYKKSESYLQPDTLSASGLIPPCWSLDIQAKRGGNKTHNVIFNLLDICGVRFSIKLPTAEARLEGIEPSWLE
jgi:signal transduction histidine kinase